MTMAMGGEEAAAMPPEPRPDFFAVRLRNFQTSQSLTRKKLEPPFAMGRRQRRQLLLYLEQKHQPVALSLVTVLADEAGQVQVGRLEAQAEFLVRFAAGAGVRRLAHAGVKFAATRAPEAEIRFLRPLEQQDFVALIETVKQRGNFVGQILTNLGIHSKNTTNRMRTYLYNRISSGRQQNKVSKDGLTRQSESAEVLDFIKKHKLDVVKTMEYIGSSFTGKNDSKRNEQRLCH